MSRYQNALQKAPQALLELLRLRTQGDQPTAFSDVLTPVIESTEFYGADQIRTAATTGAAAAVNASVTAIVGTTTRYVGIGGAFTVGAAAGTFLNLQLFLVWQQGGSAVPLFPTFEPVRLAAGRTYYFGGLLQKPLVLPAGTQINALSLGDAGGADHVLALRLLLQDPTV